MKILASGSKGNCYVKDDLMIECGLSFDKILKLSNYDLKAVQYCILTHFHKDHSKAANDLIKHGIQVYASAETFANLKLKSYVNCYTIRAGGIYELGSWTIYPFEAEHCEGALYFVLDRKNKISDRLLFSTDNRVIRQNIAGLTEIYIEANHSRELLDKRIAEGLTDRARAEAIQAHMSFEDCLDWLKKQDLSKVRSITLLHLSDSNANEKQFIETVEKTTGIPTYGVKK